MRSLQELSDRLDLDDLLTAYSYAVDFHRFDDLDDVFTPDAEIDYTATGGIRGSLAEAKSFLAQVLPGFAGHQHLVATSSIVIDGDTATGRTLCHNPMWSADGTVMYVGFWYLDEFVRTGAGWRIRRRVQQAGYLTGLPQR